MNALVSRLLPLALLPSIPQAEEFPEPFNNDPDGKDGPPMTPAEAAAAFELPEGFKATVFAGEPQVQNPIAMAWDGKGRMWVAENYTYSDRKTHFEEGLRDRVLVLEDTDGDGVADKRTVFTDDVRMLTSVEVGRGGVWLMCPPQLLFVPDANGDLVPDGPAEVVLDGFTVADANYHNFANGLRWGPDSWLYGRCGHSCPGKLGVPGTPEAERVPIDGGIWRFRPGTGIVEVLTHGTVNPWGHDWDEHGELFFVNTVIGHLWHMIPGAHFKESFGQSLNPRVYERIGQHADHYHYDRGESWTKSRHGAADEFGGGHSHIGACIYQGGLLPESWQGKLLTWNQHGRRLNVERLERHGSGYVGRHEPDQFKAGDPWFRGLEIRTGPGGALYALDWSDTGECHDHTGVHRTSGRIYRFGPERDGVSESPGPSESVELLEKAWGVSLKESPSENESALLPFTDLLTHPNIWAYRRWLAEGPTLSQEFNYSPALRAILSKSDVPVLRLRAIWGLYALGEIDPTGWLDDPDEHVRAWAIRLGTDLWPLDTLHGKVVDGHAFLRARLATEQAPLLTRLTELARTDDSGLVRLVLASTLQRLPHSARPALAKALASHAEDAEDHNLPLMVWYGIMPLVDTDPAVLLDILASSTWPSLDRWIARSLGGTIETQPSAVATILERAATRPEKREALLLGLRDAFKGRKKLPRPKNWEEVAPKLEESPILRELSVLFGDGLALEAIRATALDNKEDHLARRTALKSLIEARPADLRAVCEQLLGNRDLRAIAVRGLALSDDPKLGERLAKEYPRFKADERPVLIEALSSRPAWAGILLDRIAKGQIPRPALTPFHARQILGFDKPALSESLRTHWGELRKTDREKEKQIAALKREMKPEILAKAELGKGRVLYAALCASCHQLYGEGGKLGPDLTGSGRSQIDYLLENIVDPSAVVPADFRMIAVRTKDGRALSGVVASESEKTLTLRLLTEETTLEKSEIESRETLPDSIMPAGLIDALTPEQRRDLLAYLMHPAQVPMP